MTKLFNDPARFTEDMLVGFLDANSAYVVGVPGGVVRAHKTAPGKVAVVIGGGSGHYPAFCGTVGPGFADGAVVGNIFTSPSAEEAASVSRAAHGDAGVLLTTGNYAGDVMNFGLAVTQLRSEGIDAHYFAVTDDIASAPLGEEAKRRGIAGDVTVFKCASAAAEDGLDLAGVVRVTEAANAATRTLGVAFDGCTLPGADKPLFTVPEGHMGLGLGIHGEPGVAEEVMPTAADLAKTLVDGVLADRQDASSQRIAVILNGLGRTKYEELFVVWGEVARLLRERGYTIVEPEVGELVTSLDMAGCSLTVSWLDDELEQLWLAPADSPAFRRSAPAPLDPTPVPVGATLPAVEASTEAGQQAGVCVRQAVEAVAALLRDLEDELGRLDAVAGDGDHGRGMARGSSAALAGAITASDAGGDAPTVLRNAGEEWADKAGGTSGALWGAGLLAAAERLPSDAVPTDADVVAAVVNAWQQVKAIGGAEVGDKTLVDALEPFAVTLQERFDAGDDLETAWTAAVSAAQSGAASTSDIAARLGRSLVLGAKSP